jgi:hypothetical protein
MCGWLDVGRPESSRGGPPVPRIRPLLSLLAALLAVAALAACGSSGDGSGASGSGGSEEEKRLAFADCLRDEGVDVQMSQDGRSVGFHVSARGPQAAGRATFGGPDDPNGPFARCRKKTGWAPSPPSEAEQARMRDEMLRFARCMREHGVDMPDPSPDGRILVRTRADGPTTQAALRACGRGGRPGGGDFAVGG